MLSLVYEPAAQDMNFLLSHFILVAEIIYYLMEQTAPTNVHFIYYNCVFYKGGRLVRSILLRLSGKRPGDFV